MVKYYRKLNANSKFYTLFNLKAKVSSIVRKSKLIQPGSVFNDQKITKTNEIRIGIMNDVNKNGQDRLWYFD